MGTEPKAAPTEVPHVDCGNMPVDTWPFLFEKILPLSRGARQPRRSLQSANPSISSQLRHPRQLMFIPPPAPDGDHEIAQAGEDRDAQPQGGSELGL